MCYSLIRPLLFCLPPETAHSLALHILNSPLWMTPSSPYPAPPYSCMGLTFPNRVGIAAGLDKDAKFIQGLFKLGVGFVEVGTVTPLPQIGNPQPRLFRLPAANALINRMGFNNGGIAALVDQFQQLDTRPGLIGINIGKNKDTPLAKATRDYLTCLHQVYPYADYITVNLSSPNTPGLVQLQQAEHLAELLDALKNAQGHLQQKHQRRVPLVVKLSPDLSPEALATAVQLLLQFQVEGVIATNTTQARDGVVGLKHGDEQGGLSGAPLADKSTQVIAQIHQLSLGKLPIIGVGGIQSRHNAKHKLQAGAQLLQVYTGLIYRGPGLIKEILRAID